MVKISFDERKEGKMQKVLLLNSAIMPQPGWYYYTHISPEEAKKFLEQSGCFESFIGYEATARILERILALPPGSIPVNRRTTKFERKGQVAIVFRLTKRLPDEALKGALSEEELLAWPHELGLIRYLGEL